MHTRLDTLKCLGSVSALRCLKVSTGPWAAKTYFIMEHVKRIHCFHHGHTATVVPTTCKVTRTINPFVSTVESSCHHPDSPNRPLHPDSPNHPSTLTVLMTPPAAQAPFTVMAWVSLRNFWPVRLCFTHFENYVSFLLLVVIPLLILYINTRTCMTEGKRSSQEAINFGAINCGRKRRRVREIIKLSSR